MGEILKCIVALLLAVFLFFYGDFLSRTGKSGGLWLQFLCVIAGIFGIVKIIRLIVEDRNSD